MRHLDLVRRCAPSLVPGVLLLVTALISITGPGFSWDEVATADIAGRTPPEIWRLMRHIDAVLGPYYLAMHAWTALAGTSETALRLPQVIAMALAAALTGELGRRLFSPLTGLTAGLILVVIPNSFRYAAEARPYAFSVLFSALSLLLLHTALRRPRWWRWALYGLSVLLLGLSHLVGVSILAAHALIVLRRDRRLLRAWAPAAAIVVALLAPLASLGAGQQSGQVAWIRPLSVAVLRRSPAELIGSSAVAWLLIVLVVLVVARFALLDLVALCVVPMAALAGYSLLVGPLWVPRYLLVVLPPMALLAAAAIVPGARPPVASEQQWPAAASWTRARPLAQVALVLVVFVAAAWPGQREQRADLAKNGSDYRALTRLIQERDQAGDVILYQDGNRALRAGVDFYYRGDPGRPVDLLLRRTAGQVAGLIADEYPDVAGRLDGVERVWLVVASTGAEDPLVHKPRVAPVLRAGFRRAGLFRVHGATVAFYRRRA
ncbi:glycosyltransferase family 39 protein [Catenuloplanes sp. NPDC051500]|uniref:glycosyltransferase family 39 protein n=1 Tax=Catenuloplanes sp. NPDC051500 TaxID=3363959 RepID=UPI003798C115